MKNNSRLAKNGKTKILALTGIRSEYDLVWSLLKKLASDPVFDSGVIISGAHMSPLHNYSWRHVAADGFRVAAKIENLIYSNTAAGKAKSTAVLVHDLAQVLSSETPDLLLVTGDREEPIAGALAATYLGIPVVHLCGGDNTCPDMGDVDESVRHAVTKLSHIHLTMAESHSERIRMMGEESWRVFTVGNGGLDRLRLAKKYSAAEMTGLLGPDIRRKYIVLIYHPLSSETQPYANMRTCLDACLEAGCPVFVGSPNSDPGWQEVQRAIDEVSSNPLVHPYRNLERRAFVTLLGGAAALVGNSSLAFHEASYIGLPAVNAGQRQKGRLHGNNVVFCPLEPEALVKAVKRAVFDGKYRSRVSCGTSPYGDGHMAEKALRVLKNLPGREKLLAKRVTY
ncbi:MAG: UDP-N-acetyl-D-glucosamine 2-epimerase, UDP-hydrolysing [Elusimicrobia bacterium GWD2_63_28]|nr:MAG: UDP-N-acetyl-D-glucosamine 2-epimerase, UDP-hydrolysing [Elusimicrobia bacterium GWD2_63_28]